VVVGRAASIRRDVLVRCHHASVPKPKSALAKALEMRVKIRQAGWFN
jgi:hypothetical protein